MLASLSCLVGVVNRVECCVGVLNGSECFVGVSSRSLFGSVGVFCGLVLQSTVGVIESLAPEILRHARVLVRVV